GQRLAVDGDRGLRLGEHAVELDLEVEAAAREDLGAVDGVDGERWRRGRRQPAQRMERHRGGNDRAKHAGSSGVSAASREPPAAVSMSSRSVRGGSLDVPHYDTVTVPQRLGNVLDSRAAGRAGRELSMVSSSKCNNRRIASARLDAAPVVGT